MQPDSIYIQRNSTPFISLEQPIHTLWTTLPSIWLDTLLPKLDIRTPDHDEHVDEICWIWKGAKRTTGKPLIKVPTEVKARTFHNVLVDKRICEFYYTFDRCLNQRTIYVYRVCDDKLCLNPRHLIPKTSVNDYEEKRVDMRVNRKRHKERTEEQRVKHRAYMRDYMRKRRGAMG